MRVWVQALLSLLLGFALGLALSAGAGLVVPLGADYRGGGAGGLGAAARDRRFARVNGPGEIGLLGNEKGRQGRP